jgi:subfamily B ATP-binding cassette protein MsbA
MKHGYDGPKKPLKASTMYRDLRELIWPRRKLFLMGLVLILVNRAAGLVMPGSFKFLVDDVVGKRQPDLLFVLVGVVAVAIVVQAFTSYLLTQVVSTSAQQLIANMRVRLQEHIGRLPIRYYDVNKTGSLVSRIMSDVEGVRNLVGTGLIEFIGGLFTAVIALALLLRIHATLTLFLLVFMLGFVAVLGKAVMRVRPIFRERGKIMGEVTGRLTESLAGVRIVKGFHAEAREATAFEKGSQRIFDNVRRTIFASSILNVASTLLMGVIGIGVMIVGGRLLLNGTMTVGDFIAFTLYLGALFVPAYQVVAIGTQITEAFAGLDRMHEVMQEQPEDVDPERVVRLDRIRGHLQFDKVSFEYEPGTSVLSEITLDAIPGTVTALVGPSGSGKSTLIGLVASFAKPTTGQVFVDGVDLSTVTLESYRSQLGVVLQDNFLFDGSIKENILFGRPNASEEDVLRAATIARVDEFAFKFVAGLDTVVGERGVKLSGGQRQRVAIARAILADPRILILDEATSSLDTESEALIQEGLAALMAGRTTFVIAHRLSTIRSADQILVLEHGRIVERGTHSELLATGGRYFDLYTRQAGLEANRFVNPGEKEVEPQLSEEEKAAERKEGFTEVAQDLLGISRSPRA